MFYLLSVIIIYRFVVCVWQLILFAAIYVYYY
jgi:hypothetical protein